MSDSTIFLRLEGPLQSWGTCSRFKLRETGREPSKSGVLGLLCCAMGVRRADAEPVLKRLNQLAMGVRVDRPGWLMQDYHTVGAGDGVLEASGKRKDMPGTKTPEPVESWRDYLSDASFLVALQGPDEIVREVRGILEDPKGWVVFLGRKSCPPSRPIYAGYVGNEILHLRSALQSVPWQPRLAGEMPPLDGLRAVLEVKQREEHDGVVEARQDVPVRFRPPVHAARYVTVERLVPIVTLDSAMIPHCPPPYRGWANLQSAAWRGPEGKRLARLGRDHQLCVFCKMPAKEVHHVDYSRAPDHEDVERDLRSLCDLCHGAVTLLEYGLGRTQKRIDPLDPNWRGRISDKRVEILENRIPLHLGRNRRGEEE